MNSNSKLVRLFYSYFGSFGVAALLLALLGCHIESVYRFILPTAVALVIPAFLNVFLLCSKHQSKAELWLNRASYGVAATLCTLGSYSAFGIYNSWKILVLATVVILAVYVAFGIPLFILADRREKRKLQAMNEKFMENTEE